MQGGSSGFPHDSNRAPVSCPELQQLVIEKLGAHLSRVRIVTRLVMNGASTAPPAVKLS
jgi:hypothetical protein